MKGLDAYGRDINQPTALIMSGVESDAYWDLAVSAGFDRLLVSYHYIQRKGKKWLRERMQKHPNIKLMIDSGAYTFHANEEEYKKKPVSYFEEYVRKYTNWIKENKDIIFSCVEVDIANLVGFEKVDEFRRDYFEPLKDEGVLVCYVWHGFDGKAHWEEMCKKYDYVGFSLQGDKLTESEVMKFVNTARRYNTLVHGFAVTRVELMSKIPFFTGDSTTWLVGTQYGELNWFDGRRMKRLKKKDWKTVYKQKYIKLGANWDLAGKENPYELIRINALVFKEAEKYVKKRIRHKCYWMTKQVEGESTVAKKLLKRSSSAKPTTEEVTQKPKKKLLRKKKVSTNDNTNISSSSESSVLGKESNVGGKVRAESERKLERTEQETLDRPKTKFEEFMEISETSSNKVTYDLDEQISKLPDVEWCNSDAEDYEEVAKRIHMNITGMQKDEVLDIIYNYCVFLKDTEMLESHEDEALIDLVDFLIKKKVDSRESALEELTNFYAQNLTGDREDFKAADDFMPMEAPPRPKERETYLEDETYDVVDVSEEEMKMHLPAPKENGEMPEIEEIDKELKSAGIMPVRDENGRFLKGQKKVRKPKQLWSKHFPKLACNTCYKAGECPEFQPDMACAYEKVFKKFNTRNMEDIIDGMTSMADLNMERMQRLMLFETMDGGMADPTLTNMVDQNVRLLMQIKSLHDSRATVIAQQTRVIKDDGTETTTTSVTNPAGGILERLFMGNDSSKDRRETNEDVLDMKED